MTAPLRVGLIAGEASGDTLGAGLIEALRRLDPAAQFFGVAGPKMRAAGCEVWEPAESLAVMGLFEILRDLPRLLRLLRRLRRAFIENLPSTLSSLRAVSQAFFRADNEAAQLKHLYELYRQIQALNSNAGLAGLSHITHMSSAVVALLKEIYEKPKNINSSSIRTIAAAVDFLGFLFEKGTLPDQEMSTSKILVVDDDAISRRAVVYALEKAKLKSAHVEDPEEALQLLEKNDYELVFLDVDMPNMNGFELCAKLRAMPQNHKTPVVFVTSLNDFDSRTSSTMAGGNDFIGKPFLFIELTVKALIHVMRSRLQGRRPD